MYLSYSPLKLITKRQRGPKNYTSLLLTKSTLLRNKISCWTRAGLESERFGLERKFEACAGILYELGLLNVTFVVWLVTFFVNSSSPNRTTSKRYVLPPGVHFFQIPRLEFGLTSKMEIYVEVSNVFWSISSARLQLVPMESGTEYCVILILTTNLFTFSNYIKEIKECNNYYSFIVSFSV